MGMNWEATGFVSSTGAVAAAETLWYVEVAAPGTSPSACGFPPGLMEDARRDHEHRRGRR
jgi:hypothetical protein